MARIDLVALQQRLAQQPTPVPAEPSPLKARPATASAVAPAGTLRATTTMRAALPLKPTTNTRADRAEERAMVKALRAQIDELNAEMAVASAEAERALAEERQRADRLNKQVEALSAEVAGAKKQAAAVLGRAERAEAGRDAERARAEALRSTIDELEAGQAMMADMHARELVVARQDALATQEWAAELRRAERRRGRRGGLWRASGRRAGGVSDRPPGLAWMPSTADVTPPLPGAWCWACQGTRWWTERHQPRGWRCANGGCR
jgi:hypothetical protein